MLLPARTFRLFMLFTPLLAIFVVLGFSQEAVLGQSPNYHFYPQPDVNEVRERAEEIRKLGESAVRDVKKLPRVLPELVKALNDDRKEVRSAAVQVLGSAARKIDRLSYWNMLTPQWEALEPHFNTATQRLDSLAIYSRVQRDIDRLISRKNQQRLLAAAPKPEELPPPPPSLSEDANRFIGEFCRLREDQIVDMWLLAKSGLPQFDASMQKLIFKELLQVAQPRWFEFALMLTDDFDDPIIEAILDSLEETSQGDYPFVLTMATPKSAEVRARLAQIACDWARSNEDRELALTCLANSSECEPDSIGSIVEAYTGNSPATRFSEFYRFALKNRAHLSTVQLALIKAHGIALIETPTVDTWQRSDSVHSLSEMLPGDPELLAAIKGIMEQGSQSNEELVFESLVALPYHGRACVSLAPHLMHLVSSEDEAIREVALQGLAEIQGLDRGAIELLVTRITSRTESQPIKESIVKVLRRNSQLASDPLRHAIIREMFVPVQDRCLIDLLRAAEGIGRTNEGVDLLCANILKDSDRPIEERIAAIMARGVCAPETKEVISELYAILQSSKESFEVKSAAILALSRLSNNGAIPVLSEYTSHPDELIACSARYGYHLAGESNTSIHLLLAMVPSSSMRETIVSIIDEIGPSGQKALYETLDSRTATMDQKEIAYRALASHEKPDWNRLLGFLTETGTGETGTGDSLERALREGWNFDLSIIPPLFDQIETSPRNSVTAQRAWRLADDFTSGLGAGGDAEDGSYTAMQSAIVNSSAMPRYAPAETAPSASESNDRLTAAPPPSPGLLPPSPTPVVASVASDTGIARTIDVFYGTNRQPLFTTTFGNQLKWGAFGIALISIVVCLYGFACQRLVSYTLAATFGLVGLTTIARDSLDFSFWFPELAKTYSGNYSDEVRLGVCKVTIPKTHVVGQLESPSLFLRMEVRPDPSKHIVLAETKPLSESEFYSKLNETMDQEGKNLLVFIHGYNVSFEDAARRTAQMAVDLKFAGAPVFYSWPSHSDWYRYPDDAANIQNSIGQIRGFLEKLARDSGAHSINIVAHSMGNVGLTNALASLESKDPLFNQVVLAAPDIDANVFRNEIAPKLAGKAKRVTLYTSQTDLALLASRYFNAGVRVGDSSYGVSVFPGIETIDATSIDSSLLGHSYYGSNVNVLEDIAKLLSEEPISNRTYLEVQSGANPPYWSFSPQVRTATIRESNPKEITVER